jgi:hypothetical protein
MVVECPSKLPQFLDATVDVLDALCQQVADFSTGGQMRPALPPRQQLPHIVECQPE